MAAPSAVLRSWFLRPGVFMLIISLGDILCYVHAAATTAAAAETTTYLPIVVGICDAPAIPHSGVRGDVAANYSAGTVVEIVCDSGYRFPHIKSSVLQVVCRADGTWTDLLGIENVPSCESCLSDGFIDAKFCYGFIAISTSSSDGESCASDHDNVIGGCPVPQIANGVMELKTVGNMPGDWAVIHCNTQYVITPRSAKPTVVCHKDGLWKSESVEFPSCKAADMCQLPPEILNGGFQIIDSQTTGASNDSVRSGASILYYCSDNYRLMPSSSQFADCIDGVWSNRPPTCQLRQAFDHCGPVPEIPNARHYTINGSSDRDGTFQSGVKIVYVCEMGYRQACASCSPTSTCIGGDWIGHGPKCVPELGCLTSPPNVVHAAYTISRKDEINTVMYPTGTHIPDGAHASYYCNSGYRLLNNNASTLVCSNGEWAGLVPTCIKRTGCDTPMDIENGNYIIDSLFADYRFGVQVTYECDEGYKAIGTTDITCLATGYWSDYPPKCLAKDEYCSEPSPVRDGFFMCKPSQCDSFRVGTELHYVCNKNYKLNAPEQTMQTCLPGGHWSHESPVCLPDFVINSAYLAHGAFSTNTLTVIVSSSCAVLGLLVLVMLAIAIQRRLKPHSSTRLCNSSLPGSGPPVIPDATAPYPVPIRDSDEHDRLALIAFADDIRNSGISAPLPTYEEAMRGPTPHIYHGFTHFVDGGSRTSSGRSSRSGDYRQLPSIRLMRDASQPQPVTPSASSGDPRRNSIVTMASNNLSAAAFGSMDTVNAAASDATSTSVTVDTYDSMASNPSIVASQRATAGSIESSSTHGSLANEAAPLLDACGCDTLRSQSSRGTHSDTSSRIVEVPEDCKDD